MLNSTNEKYNSKNFCSENVSTKVKTGESIPLTTKNLLEKTYNSKEKGEQKEFLGKKIKRKESKKRNHKKRREKSMNKDGKKTSFIENQDNSLKSAMKAPFFLFVLLINQLGNITLENINLSVLDFVETFSGQNFFELYFSLVKFGTAISIFPLNRSSSSFFLVWPKYSEFLLFWDNLEWLSLFILFSEFLVELSFFALMFILSFLFLNVFVYLIFWKVNL